MISINENHRADLPRVTTRTPSVRAVVEVDLSLPIGAFNFPIATAASSFFYALGYIADSVINTLWPAEAVARAPSRDYDRAVRVVDQLTEPPEPQGVWKRTRRAPR